MKSAVNYKVNLKKVKFIRLNEIDQIRKESIPSHKYQTTLKKKLTEIS